MQTKHFLKAVRGVCAIMTVVGLSACGGGDAATGPTSVSIAGTWNLKTINGSTLPFVVLQTATDKVEITADVLNISGSGSFTELTSLKLTSNGSVTNQSESDAGSYTRNGTAVSFTFQSDGSNGTGTVAGNTITVAEDGLSIVYQKQ